MYCRHHADPTAVDSAGNTPGHLAAMHGHLVVLAELIKVTSMHSVQWECIHNSCMFSCELTATPVHMKVTTCSSNAQSIDVLVLLHTARTAIC